ncbi:MAG: hypothetical protein EBS86_13385 [Crocinitomicaceae bacterium]|nr:hypothetical protein [Crocinitomicaceae bacterium]
MLVLSCRFGNVFVVATNGYLNKGKIMTKEQIWELLEIHNLLCDTDQVNNHYGLNLFTAFIETYCLAIQEEENV